MTAAGAEACAAADASDAGRALTAAGSGATAAADAPGAAALEQAVAVRKAQAARRRRAFADQLAQARRAGVATTGEPRFADLAAFVRAAADLGLAGDDIAGALGARRLPGCFWLAGFLPGLAVSVLCAALAVVLTDRALASTRLAVDGESAAFLLTAATLPVVLAAAAFAPCAARAVRAAGTRGFRRAAAGYALAVALTALALAVRAACAPESLRVILFRA